MANPLSQPNRRSDGKSEKAVTIKPHASTTDVRINGGPTSTGARSTGFSRSSPRPPPPRHPVRKRNVGLPPQPNQTASATPRADQKPPPPAPKIFPQSA